MQRCEFDILLATVEYVFGNQHRSIVVFRTVNNTVTDGGNLIHRFYHTAVISGQSVQNHLNGFFMVGHLFFKDKFFTVRLVRQNAAFDTDTLAKTFCDDGFVFHIDKLILQAAATGIDN